MAESWFFFTMQLLKGETLSERLEKKGPLEPAEALGLLADMTAALDAAHKVGIVHRDFKPGNVFLLAGEKDVRAVVTDFGIAAQTGTIMPGATGSQQGTDARSTVAGAPAYMAPEQFVGAPARPATDVYSLALVAFEMVTGKRAFTYESSLACALSKLDAAACVLRYPAVFPERWKPALDRAVCPDAARRPQTAESLLKALQPRRPVLRRVWPWLLAAMVLLATVAQGWRTERWFDFPPNSIAVLPFSNLSGDPELRYFSDGLSEELTSALSAYPKLHVLARAASSHFTGSSQRPGEVARALGARMLVVGAVQRTPSRLRPSIQLIDGQNERQLWSKIYDRDLGEAPEVLANVLGEVKQRMLPDSPSTGAELAVSSNAEAYDLYLRGRFFWNRRTRDDILKSVDFFERAIAIDSRFGLAHTALADAYLISADYGWMKPADSIEAIRNALDRALAIDSNAAETQASLGLFRSLLDWDQAGAERAFKKAIQGKPSLLTAHHWYGSYLMRARRFDEALVEAATARKLDPISIPTLLFEGWVQYYRRDYSSAIRVARAALELDPKSAHAHQLLALSHAERGRIPEALASLSAAVEFSADPAVALRYRALVLSRLPGHEGETRQVAQQLELASTGRQAGYLAIVYGALGDRDVYMRGWREGVTLRDPALSIAHIMTGLDDFRSDQRFIETMQRIGYAD